jgi:hypothetical protein
MLDVPHTYTEELKYTRCHIWNIKKANIMKNITEVNDK